MADRVQAGRAGDAVTWLMWVLAIISTPLAAAVILAIAAVPGDEDEDEVEVEDEDFGLPVGAW